MSDAASTAAAILDREFPGAEVRSLRDVSGGQKTTVIAALADRAVVVTACDVPAFTDACTLEPAVLRLVGRESAVPVPRVLASEPAPEDLPPYYLTARVEGSDPSDRYKYLPRAEREELIEAAARTLGTLHRDVTFDAPGRLCRGDGGLAVSAADSWPSFLASTMRGWIDELRGGRFADLIPTYEAAADRMGAADIEGSASLLHFDFRPANLLVREGEIAAVVDWGLARAGDPAYDLFKAEKNFLLAHFETPSIREDLREPFFRGYEDVRARPEDWHERRARYRVAYKLESMRSFDRWAPPSDRDAVAERLREELADDLAHRAWDNL